MLRHLSLRGSSYRGLASLQGHAAKAAGRHVRTQAGTSPLCAPYVSSFQLHVLLHDSTPHQISLGPPGHQCTAAVALTCFPVVATFEPSRDAQRC